MNIDGFSKFVEALSKLISALIWPSLVLFVLIRFQSEMTSFFSNLSEFSLKGAGFEASAKRKQAEATAALAAANVSRPQEGAAAETVAKNAITAAEVVAEAATPAAIRRVAGSNVLLVDDNPNNSIYERMAFEALGIRFTISTSTEDAIAKLSSQKIDLILSDMKRPGDNQAGYTLIDEIRKSGNKIPVILYTASVTPEQQAEAKRRGALGITNRPDELFQLVLTALKDRPNQDHQSDPKRDG